MLKRSMALVLLLEVALLGGGYAHAEGVVQSASKDVAKGAVKGLQQELNSGTIIEGAKQVTKGAVDGISAAAPTVTSQLIKQTNLNRKAISNVARTVSQQAVAGAVVSTTTELQEALGKDGDGPLAKTMAASAEKIMAATVRGVVAGLPPADGSTTEKLAAAAMRGARSEVHVNFPVGSFVLAFVLGGFSTLLCGFGLMMLYLLFQKHRPVSPVVAPTPASIPHGQPAYGTR
jgi:hypothetical protein